MAKQNRIRLGRRKAQFGADGAIMAAATLAAAGINAAASANAAKQQASAMESAAKTQADALAKQNENANTLQQQSIDFTKDQNDRNRDLQKEIQMNLQLLTGQQNTNQMKDAARIQVRNGGNKRRRLRYNGASSLQAGNNIPFSVTDGGSVIPIGSTPEGYDLYEIYGNDHNHYHKTRGGKYKSGVGIKFADGQVVEGEGNQNSNRGELLLVTPDDAKFISKHSIKGFNPADAVRAGMHPYEAFARQEIIKDINGISDDGKENATSPVRGMRAYGGISTLPISPDLSLDFLAPVATGIVSGTREAAKNGRRLRYGGRAKKPGGGGYSIIWDIEGKKYEDDPYGINSSLSSSAPASIPSSTSTPSAYSSPTSPYTSLDSAQKGNLVGAGINAAGNLTGALISTIGNNIASRYLTRGYNKAGNMLADAYGNLKGIDMNAINRDDFRAAHAMAALQAPIINTSAERTIAERTRDRLLSRINKGTLSSAAAQNRSAVAETNYNDQIGQIENNANKARQEIIQSNMQRLTDVSKTNAQLDTEANKDYANAYLSLLQYNNDIENEKITGAAQARADALTQSASALASTRQANAAGWAGAISSSANNMGTTLATNAKMLNDYNMTLLGASDDSVLRLIYGSDFSANNRAAANGIYQRYKNSNDDNRRKIAEELKARYKFA